MRRLAGGLLAGVLAACASAPTPAPAAPTAAPSLGPTANVTAAATPTPTPTNTCVATSPATFNQCGIAVQAGRFTIIEVQGRIDCGKADPCSIEVHDRGFVLRGTPGAVIRRTAGHDKPLVAAIGGSRFVVQDLTIDEDVDIACLPVQPTNPPVENAACALTFNIYGVGETIADHLTVIGSKSVAFHVTGGDTLVVRHARFVRSFLFGLQVDNLAHGLVVEDSLFSGIDSNAMVLYALHGTADAPLLIRNTLFDHNHRADVYWMCGPDGDKRCSGGQLLLVAELDFVRVEGTIIRNGMSDVDDAPVAGVEINFPAIHDIAFVGDDVHDNTMWGISVNSQPTDVSRITFTGTKLYGNATDPNYLGQQIGNFKEGHVAYTEVGDCSTPDCTTVPFGGLWALPGHVSWLSNDLATPNVTVDGVPASTDADGDLEVASGSQVVLFDGTTELDRLIVP